MADNSATDTIQLAVANATSGTADPSAGAGVAAPVGSIYLRSDGTLWNKTGALDTNWVLSGTPVPLGRTVVVAKSGGDVTTIAAGLIAVAALVPAPDAANPAVVIVSPGVYSEVPLTAIGHVSVASSGGAEVTVITATVTTSPIFTGAVDGHIHGFTLRGADGVGGIGISHTGGTFFTAEDVIVQDCTKAYESSGAGTNLTLDRCLAQRRVGETLDIGFSAVLAGTLRGVNLRTIGVPAVALIAAGLHADGAGSVIAAQMITCIGCTDALLAENTGTVEASNGAVQLCTNGLRIAPTSGTLRLTSIAVVNSTTWDLLVQSATAVYRGSLCTLRNDMISVDPGASFLSLHTSEVTGEDSSLTLISELAVGNENRPFESAFGGGDSHVRNLSVFRNTNLEVGTWSDITVEMSSAIASTADPFPGVTANNAVYIGGAVAFPNIKPLMTVAITLGAGALIWEYSNGAGWTAMNVMATESNAPYTQNADDTFGVVGGEQVRFGDMAGFATQAVNGVTKFWVRCRIATGITTSPTLQQIKLGTNRSELNGDGSIEHFGNAERVRSLRWHQRLVNDLNGAASGNANIAISTSITAVLIDNQFANNTRDGVAGIVEIPEGFDTSMPLTLEFSWIPKATGGDVEFQTDSAPTRIGDALDGTAADVNQALVETVPAIDVLVRSSFDYDVSELRPGDFLGFALTRDATGGNDPPDTLVGNVNLVTVDFKGTFWR